MKWSMLHCKCVNPFLFIVSNKVTDLDCQLSVVHVLILFCFRCFAKYRLEAKREIFAIKNLERA